MRECSGMTPEPCIKIGNERSVRGVLDLRDSRLHLQDGSTTASTFTTRRRRKVGEIVNLPTAWDGSSRVGRGYRWRVRAIEENENALIEATLVLEPTHPDQT